MDQGIGVPAADDGQPVHPGHGLGQSIGSLGKGRVFKSAHGSVPDHGFCVFQDFGKQGVRSRTDVQHHLPIRNVLKGIQARWLLVVRSLTGDKINRKIEADPVLLSLANDLQGILQKVVFHPGASGGIPQGFEKGVGHGPAHDDPVHLVQQVGKNAEFGGDFGAS